MNKKLKKKLKKAGGKLREKVVALGQLLSRISTPSWLAALSGAVLILGYLVIIAEKSVYDVIEANSFKVTTGNGHGTAFFIRDQSTRLRLITAKHVCEGFEGGSPYLVVGDDFLEVSVINTDAKEDICELTLPKTIPNTITGLPLADKELRAHESVYGGGFPSQLNLIISKGIFSGPMTVEVAHSMEVDPAACIQKGMQAFPADPFGIMFVCLDKMTLNSTTASIYPGHSGSAAVNSQGQVVGIFVVSSRPSYSGMYVRFEKLKEFLANGSTK